MIIFNHDVCDEKANKCAYVSKDSTRKGTFEAVGPKILQLYIRYLETSKPLKPDETSGT